MRANWPTIKDGLATGIVLAIAIALIDHFLGRSLLISSGWVFIAGIAMCLLSSVWAFAGYRSPPGLLGIWSGEAEVYPSAGRTFWLDRLISTHNVWLIAGLVMILISLIPPLISR
jgi:hypothetical protein